MGNVNITGLGTPVFGTADTYLSGTGRTLVSSTQENLASGIKYLDIDFADEPLLTTSDYQVCVIPPRYCIERVDLMVLTKETLGATTAKVGYAAGGSTWQNGVAIGSGGTVGVPLIGSDAPYYNASATADGYIFLSCFTTHCTTGKLRLIIRYSYAGNV